MSTITIDGVTYAQAADFSQATLKHMIGRKLLYVEDNRYYYVIAFQSFIAKDSASIDSSKSLNVITISLDRMRDGKAQTAHLTGADPLGKRTLPTSDYYSEGVLKRLGEVKVLTVPDCSQLYIPSAMS